MSEQAAGIPLAEHQSDCGCSDEEEFRCARCNMLVGWCMGAADNAPDVCDACWYQLNVDPVPVEVAT